MKTPRKIPSLSLAASSGLSVVTASGGDRVLAGELVRFGVPGRTSIGALRVRPGALRFPDDITRVKLTREHDLEASRGHATSIVPTPNGIRASCRPSDGPEGDAAIQEAVDKTRDAFSYHVVDATVVGDELTDGLVVAIAQVGIPAYDDSRIDTIAASAAATPGRNTMLSPEQAQRLLELQAKIDNGETLADDEQKEFDALKTLSALQHAAPDAGGDATVTASQGGVHVHVHGAGAPAAETEDGKQEKKEVAASMSAVPPGAPTPPAKSSTSATPRGGALREMVSKVTAALVAGRDSGEVNVAEIKAALSDVISTDHTGDIEQGGWSGELWSGQQYQPVWSDLLEHDTLTYWTGRGWRFTSTPSMQDYAGDKAAIPSGTVGTEDSSYTAFRKALGLDIDRKFYDFPNEAFLNGLFERIRETWEIEIDFEVRDWILANVVSGTRSLPIAKTNADATITASAGSFRPSDVGATITGSGIPNGTTILSVTNSGSAEMSANATNGTAVTATIGAQEGSLLKSAGRAGQVLVNRRVGRPDWVMVNDEDLFTLMDVSEQDLPAFLGMWNIEPKNFRSSPDCPQGSVLAGAKRTAKLRTLPGSPVRVSAQHIANGGVDEAVHGYWAIEEQHTSGIVSVKFRQS